jgi:uncharacterized protein (DUF952 family)
MTTVYRILSREAFEAAQRRGAFLGSAHDLRDGFIHFSAAHQVAETAVKHYAGQSDLVLLWVDADALGSALKWELSRGADRFPHLYGPLPISAVQRVEPLPLDGEGNHVLPGLSSEPAD